MSIDTVEVAEKSPDKTLAAWAKTRKAAVTANIKPAPKAGGKSEKR